MKAKFLDQTALNKKVKAIKFSAMITLGCLSMMIIVTNDAQAKGPDSVLVEKSHMQKSQSIRVNRTSSSVQISVSFSGELQNPLAVYFTPVGGGQTLSFFCFSSTTFSIPTGSYDVKFTIPAADNPFHQIDVPGYAPIWITPFPGEPYNAGGEINNLTVGSDLTINVS